MPGKLRYAFLTACCFGAVLTPVSAATLLPSRSPGALPAQEALLYNEGNLLITRQLSEAIYKRLNNAVFDNFQNGSQHDASNLHPTGSPTSNGFWNAFSWSRIANDGNIPTDIKSDIYQNTFGYDRKFGNLYLGAAFNYAHVEGRTNAPTPQGVPIFPNQGFGLNPIGFKSNQAHADHNADTGGITPYFAYAVNQNIVLSAFTGYYYTALDTTPPSGIIIKNEADSYHAELAINGFHHIDNWFMSGKIGTRYVHTHIKSFDDFGIKDLPLSPSGNLLISLPGFVNTKKVTRDNEDIWTYLTSLQGGYAFNNGIRIYSGVLFEYVDPQSITYREADSVFYYNLGIDFAINNVLNIGLKGQTDLSNDDYNLTTAVLDFQLIF